MADYAILVYPSANRVYTDSAPELLAAELAVFGDALGVPLTAEPARLGGVDYVRFGTDRPLGERELALLSNTSALYALFEVTGELLRPVPITPLARFDDDLLTIQKYSGKTNELFTRLLVNVTALAAGATLDRPLRLLDPLCGRGTTLNQAMMYGWHGVGFDVDGRDFDAYEAFLKTWLRTKRVKHTATTGAVRRNKVRLGRRMDVEYGHDKESYKAGDTRTLSVFNCDTLTADELLRPASVDLVVTDAPYGVQHGSHRQTTLQRSPAELLAAAVPVWTRVLRSGGALGISWNTRVTPRADLVSILDKAGLAVREGGPYDRFEHRVDQSIVRDLVVGVKP
ncbi:TRM11 family SAM-dependent methyltransferase [Amycolatopsis suaedae]|uniref:SAM-dependent methyltransferase n=1 Tax=Amycolatopsis suaedae TaxID=2510978 RepID=A0A4Q7J1G7_9PSEU|nr:SAM-dependent methyltransferase [Amycolatopsis suaedae]RZQ59774.1 SAM-dependent methyltransferase [Amycolatopsis suaedae]